VGAVGALVSVSMLSGCPGTLDPDVAKMATGTGSGGATGSGGSGNGGSNPTGGATGTGGTMASNCTGNNDGATIVMSICAQAYCHTTASANDCGGLYLTVDSGISGRLIGVMSMGSLNTNGSACAGQTTEPYLVANSNPATGLLIDKLKANRPCGSQMPLDSLALTTTQTACLTTWATTLTHP
jgi:hypothetical protein